MKPVETKQKAISLRVVGRMTTTEIAKELQVSQSSVATWVREYPLTDEEKKPRYISEKGLENLKRHVASITLPDEVVFTEDSPYAKVAKRRRYKELPDVCQTCGQGPIWNGLALRFQIDHVDGDERNNTRENLRKVCPNCHTQTETWGNKKRFMRKQTRAKSKKTDKPAPQAGSTVHAPGCTCGFCKAGFTQ